MYHVPYFKTVEQTQVIQFMREHPFVTIVGTDATGLPVASHVPVLIEERNDKLFLLGHFMRKQEHTIAFEQKPEALAIFHGPHCYVSAQWYEPQNVASTWNYMTVHAKGKIQFLDEQALIAFLGRLTDYFEGAKDSPAAFAKMDPQYVQQMAKAIVAFEIEVSELEHVFKLSQNKPEAIRQNIIAHLDQGDAAAQAVGKAMKYFQ